MLFKGLKKLFGFIAFIFAAYIVFQVAMLLFPVKYESVVEENAGLYNLEKNLVYGIINAESRFDQNAVSGKGAVGLMQIKEDTALWCADKMGLDGIDVSQLKNPETNIKIGTWYFSYLKEQLGTESLAIIAYNAGITHVKDWLEKNIIDINVSNSDSIPFEETKKYIKKVRIYEKVYGVLEQINKISDAVKGWVNK